MSDVAFARSIASELVQLESRGSGDKRNAMQRIARRDGVPFGFLWALAYRPPEEDDLKLRPFKALLRAYERACQRQTEKLRNDIERVRAIAGSLDPVVLAAEAVAARAEGTQGNEDAP